MAIIVITNKTSNLISTTIGSVSGLGNSLRVFTDNIPIPKQLYLELEKLRGDNRIEYDVIEDPDMRNEIESAFYLRSLATPLSKIGDPTDGSYSDGFFTDWTKDTKIADALDAVSETMLQIVPAKAGALTGVTLDTIGVIEYVAKVPSGLSSYWGGVTPGSIITTIYTNTYQIATPDISTRFRAGRASDLTTAGILTYALNGAVHATYNIGQYGPGTIGPITISSLITYNTVWLKANAYVNITQLYEGKIRHIIAHTEAGMSAELVLYYDDVNTPPSFLVALTASINTVISKWLSGIEAYGLGTTIDVGYTADSGIFRKTYHPTAVGYITCPGHTTSNDNPSSPPDLNDTMVVSRTITLDTANQISLTPQVVATIQKPNLINAVSNVSLLKYVNTYGIISTNKTDQFVDEARRIVLDSGTYSGDATPFNSTIPLINGNAQQRHSGVLQYPDIIDYPGFTGPQQYQRFISKPSASIGLLNISIPYTNVSRYNIGALNILLHLSTTGKYFDLGIPIGDFNGDGSGNSPANSIGAQNSSTSSGNIIGWSIGTYSTAYNNNEYRLIVIFNNDTLTLDNIAEA